MQKSFWFAPVCLAGFLLLLRPAAGFAQGSLTPPGAPAPGFKTLTQIEPRTPVDALNTPSNGSAVYAITQPGSYYLTTNVVATGSAGIEVLTNNVTVDLNGFTVMGVGISTGIIIGASTNVVLRNGIVTGWFNGVDAAPGSSTPTRNLVLERLQVTTNRSIGILCYNARISDCVISDNGTDGVRAFVDYGTLTRCLVQRNQANGFYVLGAHWLVSGNQFVANNLGNASGTAAIYLVSDSNVVQDNYVIATGPAGYGIAVWNYVSYTNNVIVRNTVLGGGANNYSIANNSAQDVGPIGSAASATSPFANLSR